MLQMLPEDESIDRLSTGDDNFSFTPQVLQAQGLSPGPALPTLPKAPKKPLSEEECTRKFREKFDKVPDREFLCLDVPASLSHGKLMVRCELCRGRTGRASQAEFPCGQRTRHFQTQLHKSRVVAARNKMDGELTLGKRARVVDCTPSVPAPAAADPVLLSRFTKINPPAGEGGTQVWLHGGNARTANRVTFDDVEVSPAPETLSDDLLSVFAPQPAHHIQLGDVEVFVFVFADLDLLSGARDDAPLKFTYKLPTKEFLHAVGMFTQLSPSQRQDFMRTVGEWGRNPVHHSALAPVDQLQKAIEMINVAPLDAINHRDHYGNTPLNYAVARYQLHLVKALLAHGADPTICDNIGRDAFAWADFQGKYYDSEAVMDLRKILEQAETKEGTDENFGLKREHMGQHNEAAKLSTSTACEEAKENVGDHRLSAEKAIERGILDLDVGQRRDGELLPIARSYASEVLSRSCALAIPELQKCEAILRELCTAGASSGHLSVLALTVDTARAVFSLSEIFTQVRSELKELSVALDATAGFMRSAVTIAADGNPNGSTEWALRCNQLLAAALPPLTRVAEQLIALDAAIESQERSSRLKMWAGAAVAVAGLAMLPAIPIVAPILAGYAVAGAAGASAVSSAASVAGLAAAASSVSAAAGVVAGATAAAAAAAGGAAGVGATASIVAAATLATTAAAATVSLAGLSTAAKNWMTSKDLRTTLSGVQELQARVQQLQQDWLKAAAAA